MLNITGLIAALFAWFGSLLGFFFIFFVVLSIFFGFSPILPPESEEIHLTFHVYWPENGTDWLVPLEVPPQSVRIVKADTTDGYESTDTPNWPVIRNFPLEPIGGPNRTYYVQGSIPIHDIDYLAAVSGIPGNYFDGSIAVKLDTFQEGDTVELVHMESLLRVDKPNIYLYSSIETIIDTIEVEVINGRIVKSDPFAHSGSSVSWQNVMISPEGMSYENMSIDWLFYEAVMNSSLNVYDSVLDFGWCIERQGGQYIFEDARYNFDEFQLVFTSKLLSIGLYSNEANDFVEWWFDTDTKLLPLDGQYALRMIDPTWIDHNFIISTGYSYDQLRLFFLCHPFNEGLTLKEPPSYSFSSNLILHEWGVIPYF